MKAALVAKQDSTMGIADTQQSVKLPVGSLLCATGIEGEETLILTPTGVIVTGRIRHLKAEYWQQILVPEIQDLEHEQ